MADGYDDGYADTPAHTATPLHGDSNTCSRTRPHARGLVSGGARGGPQLPAHSHANPAAKIDARTHVHAEANACAHAQAHIHAQAHGDADTYAHTHTDDETNNYTDTNTNANADAAT